MRSLKIKYKCWTIFFFLMGLISIDAQEGDKLMISTKEEGKFYLGVDNHFYILGMQEGPILQEQVSAFLYTSYQYMSKSKPIPLEVIRNNGEFKVHPDSLGWVEFHVLINGQIEKTSIAVESLKAVCRYGGKVDGKLSAKKFREQLGLIAYLDLEDYNARCVIKQFQLIRVGADGTVLKSLNIKGKLQPLTKAIVEKATKGDLYIFRKIHYYCPRSEVQQGNDVILEIE